MKTTSYHTHHHTHHLLTQPNSAVINTPQGVMQRTESQRTTSGCSPPWCHLQKEEGPSFKKKKFFFSWPCWTACGIQVSQPGIEPTPPAVEVWLAVPHWTNREVPGPSFIRLKGMGVQEASVTTVLWDSRLVGANTYSSREYSDSYTRSLKGVFRIIFRVSKEVLRLFL